ncbi:hypothetical protein N4R57_19320 [Rhodobacteraceae bacterium D3-12]|nr:hypothetical protein N4R57_19320 [Rhodobacteraceae bacterium D3-12]
MTARIRKTLLATGLLLSTLAAPLNAQSYEEMGSQILAKIDAHPQKVRIESAHTFNNSIAGRINARVSASQNLSMLNAFFMQNDVDGTPGLTSGDGDILSERNMAAMRARELSRMWMQDLNGDFQITEAEMERYFSYDARKPIRSGGIYLAPTKEQVAHILDKKIEDAMKADLNGDRVLTGEELVAAFETKMQDRNFRVRLRNRNKLFPQPDLLDLDGDQSVSLTEFSDYATLIVGLMDLNDDDAISREEQRAMRYAMQQIARDIRRRNQD